ncbi:Cleft lip and palate transmembrane protein 1, putative [Eimeria tenella]|uniref:Cleft lip and palate transmembrane protein 1, putative n=1 Tax=Eimeria tenella TaxID=5802 RepID=U6KSF4_EIMTE|nr:Cleft lip and palate transmembrane protein 1, putative [Eimeria tenella]CDJ38328.1 Cleft lip and palate transmembrane protein 1, putative [Eimeria tenella]|eukprot:XP_013229166.1 Cleft lip and palate transmembrane protein 1, putative [Eimeria tenella]
MGWRGNAALAAFAAYCVYTAWDLYRATSAPVAEGRVSRSLEGLAKSDLQQIPDVLVNKIDAGSLLTYDIVLSPYPALPPLERLRQHLVWSLQEKKTLPEEFSLAGSARLKPYAFEEDEDETAADEAEAGAQAAAGAAAEAGTQQRASGAAAPWEAEPKQEALGETFWKYFKRAGRLWKAWRNYLDVSAGNVATLTATVPPNYRHGNRTLYLHVYVSDEEGNELPIHQVRRLTTHMVPEKHKVIKRYLLKDPTGRALEEKLQGLQVPGPALQCIPEFVMIGPVVENRPLHLPTLQKKLGANWPFVDLDAKTYILPPYVSADISPQDEHRPLESSPLDSLQPDAEEETDPQKPLQVNIMYQPVGFAYWFLQQMLASSFALLEDKLGLDAYDMNSLKMTAAAAAKKNSFAILVFIFFFSLAHCFLELMALQADFSFWRKQRDPSGYFSLRTLAYEVLTEVVVALYLHENESRLPLFFVCLHILLNLWKMLKFVRVSVQLQYPFVVIRKKGAADATKDTQAGGPQTPILDDKTRQGAEAFEAKCMRNLFYFFVVPLILGVGGYQLVYVPQKGWWSWFITSAAVCCYGLGFVAMTPQLFRNYYLKSVEYMPWRVLCCQFVNTFVDDVAAYVIRMPKMHRMSVFRDDVVFIIMLYQRWLYRKKRTPENAEGQEMKKVN